MAPSVQSSTTPGNGPSWDEEVVPALRKRLENESRTLDRRISAISLSLQDASSAPKFSILSDSTLRQNSTPTTPYLQSHTSASRSGTALQDRNSSDRRIPSSSSRVNGSASASKSKTPSRSRTYSQPYPSDIPNNKTIGSSRPRLNGNDVKPTRIPKASRNIFTPSQTPPPIPISNGYHYTYPDPTPSPDLYAVPETTSINSSNSNLVPPNQLNPGLLHESPPFMPGSTSPVMPPHPELRHGYKDIDTPTPRHSTDSEERPFEHWYRGEVSRNGGVGELRVGKRQEMLDIANYGHMLKSRSRPVVPSPVDDGRQRKRAGSFSRIDSKRNSVYLNEEDASRIDNVLEEDPLTDLDAEMDESDTASVSELHNSQRNYDYTPAHEDLSIVSAPLPQTPYNNRSRTPTPSVQQRQQNVPPTRIPGPPSRRSSESRVQTPTPVFSRGSSEPAVTPSASSSSPLPGTQLRQPSKSTPVAAKRGASPSASKTPKKVKTSPKPNRAKTMPNKKELEDEAYRRSIACYPTPNDEELMNAIPSWTQPVPRAGNWDDVVLPVVARKKGLDDHYKTADGNPTPKKVNDTVAPAPGTFGFNHTKYRRPLNPELIPMDEFGRPVAGHTEEQEQSVEAWHTNPQYPPTRYDEMQLPVRRMPPSSPAPFADYAPTSEKTIVTSGPPTGSGRDVGQTRQGEDDEGGAGCCKCVVM